jgi:hypothetical protein
MLDFDGVFDVVVKRKFPGKEEMGRIFIDEPGVPYVSVVIPLVGT